MYARRTARGDSLVALADGQLAVTVGTSQGWQSCRIDPRGERLLHNGVQRGTGVIIDEPVMAGEAPALMVRDARGPRVVSLPDAAFDRGAGCTAL